jgi:hypothetical protein
MFGTENALWECLSRPCFRASRKLAQAAGGVVSDAMIAATRKVKEKGEPVLQEA